MKPLSENVYVYSPEAKGFTAYPISILFVTEPWFVLVEGGTVFSTSLTAEDGHVTEPWLMKCTGSHLGFWENSLDAGLLLLLSGLPLCLPERWCGPEGGPFLLQLQGNSSQSWKAEEQQYLSWTSMWKNIFLIYWSHCLFRFFHYVQLNRILVDKWFTVNVPSESKSYIFTSFSFMFLSHSVNSEFFVKKGNSIKTARFSSGHLKKQQFFFST